MNKVTCRVYYQHKPLKNSPNESIKTQQEVEMSLVLFPSRLRANLNDSSAKVEPSKIVEASNSVIVVIQTTASESRLKTALTKSLIGLDLFAETETRNDKKEFCR